jgi:hypothetical protein
VVRANIHPSPSPDVLVAQYSELAFPKFRPLFENLPESSPLHPLALDPKEAPFAVVLENQSAKAITALRYRFVMTENSGKQRTHTLSGDSYKVDVYRPIVEPRSRQVIAPSGSVNEALMDHVLAGSGLVKMTVSGRPLDAVVEMTFEIDFVLFEDGEIAGSDPDRYGLELQFRKPGAEFIAKQIRLAMAEQRDATPVLSALAEIPCIGGLGRVQGDALVHWSKHYAQEYLRLCLGKPAPSTGERRSCDTSKIAQTCRSSIVASYTSSFRRRRAY